MCFDSPQHHARKISLVERTYAKSTRSRTMYRKVAFTFRLELLHLRFCHCRVNHLPRLLCR